MASIKELGLRGASLLKGGESFRGERRVHSAHFFELSDQPVEALAAATQEEAARLPERLTAENVCLFYVRTTTAFGVNSADELE